MKQKINKYTYYTEWSDEDQNYVGLCCEFPFLSWLEGSEHAALEGIRKLVLSVTKETKQKRK